MSVRITPIDIARSYYAQETADLFESLALMARAGELTGAAALVTNHHNKTWRTFVVGHASINTNDTYAELSRFRNEILDR